MALFKDTEDFCTVYPALESAEWTMLEPIAAQVENTMLRAQVLGPTLYDSLLAAATALHTSNTAMSAAIRGLYDRARPFVANMVAYEATPKLNTAFTSGGLKQLPVEQRAAMWATNQRRDQDLDDAFKHLNLLIDHLVANETASYSGWSTDSVVGQEVRESFIPSMTVASRHMRLHGAWLLHLLRPAMREVQNGPVRGILGETDYAALLAKVHSDSPSFTADEKKQLDEIRPAILNGAIADQLVPLALRVNKQGVWSWSASTGGGQVSGGEQPASADRMDGLIRHHQTKCQHHLKKLQDLVDPDNADGHDRRVMGDGPVTLL